MTNSNGPVLIKIGGSTLGSGDTSFTDVAALQRAGTEVVIVHGGGPEITSWMAKLGIEASFVDGLRVTDAPSLDVAAAVLAGLINKRLVAALQAEGVRAAGISGADGGLLTGNVDNPALGFVAGTVAADPALVKSLASAGFVPVIAPLSVQAGSDQLLNTNADTAAGAIAAAVGASHLLFLTDVDGVLDGNGKLMQQVGVDDIAGLVSSGVVKGGMIPKLQACAAASQAGASASIVNGTQPGALLKSLGGALRGTAVV